MSTNLQLLRARSNHTISATVTKALVFLCTKKYTAYYKLQ